MHYSNGRAAKVGDVVRGKGYNVKHEIVGRLVYAHPASSACNCQIAHIGANTPIAQPFNAYDGNISDPANVPAAVIGSSIEYGQLDAFVALDPKTGEVLAPED